METKAKLVLAIGGGVIALGAAVGVGALAANLAGGESASTQAGYGQGRAGNDSRDDRGMDTTQFAKTLAEKLGVDEAKLAAALTEVMAADRPAGRASGQPSAQPSGAPNGGSGFLETMAESLADKLDLDEAEVLAALQESMPAGGRGGAAGQPSGGPTG